MHEHTIEDERGDADIERRASERARLTGIPHYIIGDSVETWIAGQGAKDNLWADLVPLVSYDRNGERVN